MLSFRDPFDSRKPFLVYEHKKECKDCKYITDEDYCSNCHNQSLFEYRRKGDK